jgi:hypothetical protein
MQRPGSDSVGTSRRVACVAPQLAHVRAESGSSTYQT